MTQLNLVEEGEVVGYVDIDEPEAEYNGTMDSFRRLMEEVDAGIYDGVAVDSDGNPERVYRTGPKLANYVTLLAEAYGIDVEVR